MRIIGTAGHVDHGKSSLVQALTGTHPDRLKEEQERQMTIELGFASMTLPDGLEVGFVDVPGHIDFIENMLMGVGSIDAALLVIAADEGVMPQTREHLDILSLLQVQRLIVVLTKMDLVDHDWFALVSEDVREYLASYNYWDVPIVPVSSVTGKGIDLLRAEMHKLLQAVPEREDYGRPRLFIDRVFSMSGFGTIVTGTLIDGSFRKGDRVEILPEGASARIRGMQSFNEERDCAGPGNRLAMNLSGVRVEELQRGMTVVTPDTYKTTRRLAVRFTAVPGVKAAITHNLEAKFFHGSTQTQARIRVLGVDQIEAGMEGFLQIELSQPVAARFGDHFILRRPSPSETIGGGVVLDPFPLRRYRRFDEGVLSSLKDLTQGDPPEIVDYAMRQRGMISYSTLSHIAGLQESELGDILSRLISAGRIMLMRWDDRTFNGSDFTSDMLFIHVEAWRDLLEKLRAILTVFHQKSPYLRGIPVEVLRSKLDLEQGAFQFVVKTAQKEGTIDLSSGIVRLAEFEVRLAEKETVKVEQALESILSDPLNTPSPSEIRQKFGPEVYDYLRDQGRIIQVSDQVFFETGQYNQMVETLKKALLERGEMKVTEVREVIPGTRKYLLAFLEYLDRIGLTKRNGDYRSLK